MQCSILGTHSQGESFLLFCKQLMLYWWEFLVQERRKINTNNNNNKEKNYCCNKTVSVQSGGESLNSELKKFRFESSPFYFRACGHPRGFPGSSAGNESSCNAGDTSSIPGSGRSPGEEIGYPLHYSWTSLGAQSKESGCNAEELGSIPGLGGSPGRGHDNPLQYSCLENPYG